MQSGQRCERAQCWRAGPSRGGGCCHLMMRKRMGLQREEGRCVAASCRATAFLMSTSA